MRKTDIGFLLELKFGSDFKKRLNDLRKLVKVTRKWANVKTQTGIAEMLGMTKFSYATMLSKLRRGAKAGKTLEQVAMDWKNYGYSNGIAASRKNPEKFKKMKEEIMSLRKSGLNYREISDKVGKSRERIRQICLGL